MKIVLSLLVVTTTFAANLKAPIENPMDSFERARMESEMIRLNASHHRLWAAVGNFQSQAGKFKQSVEDLKKQLRDVNATLAACGQDPSSAVMEMISLLGDYETCKYRKKIEVLDAYTASNAASRFRSKRSAVFPFLAAITALTKINFDSELLSPFGIFAALANNTKLN